MKNVVFYTLGCKVNQYETDSMKAIFENAGYEIVGFDEYLLNTTELLSSLILMKCML